VLVKAVPNIPRMTAVPGERFVFVHSIRCPPSRELMMSRLAEHAEKELLTVLALKEPTYTEIDILIAKYDLCI
jgi:hypothetical protein